MQRWTATERDTGGALEIGLANGAPGPLILAQAAEPPTGSLTLMQRLGTAPKLG